MSGSGIGKRRRAAQPDPLAPDQRRHNMSRIRARDTKPEMLLRRALHRSGLRYRLHDCTLPGTPDIVMRPRGAAIFVHGCFWHAHDCPLGVIPATRSEFWIGKLERNRQRDEDNVRSLLASGWRVATVWECALTSRARRDPAQIVATLTSWLNGDSDRLEIIDNWKS